VPVSGDRELGCRETAEKPAEITADSGQQSVVRDTRQQTADSRQQTETADSRQQTRDSTSSPKGASAASALCGLNSLMGSRRMTLMGGCYAVVTLLLRCCYTVDTLLIRC
jgi:hypothetical protein